MSQDTDSTDNDLRHRLAALEDEVQSLRNDGPKVNRRLLMKGGVATLGLTALATPTSAGTNQAGTIGTEQNPQDLYSEDLYIYEQGSTPSTPPSGYIDIYAKTDGNFYKLESDGTESQLGFADGSDFDGQGTSDFTNLASVSTDAATIATRDIVEDTDQTITVGTDTTTIQEAVKQALLTDAAVTIDIPDGNYAEDVNVPSTIVNGSPNIIIISGNTSTIGNVTVDSMILGASLGKRPFRVEGIEFTSTHPDADSASLQVDGGVAIVQDCAFSASANRALCAYGGGIITKGSVDLGTDSYTNGIVVKNAGSFTSSCNNTGGDLSGSVTGYAYYSQNATYFARDVQDSLSGDVETTFSPLWQYDSSDWSWGPRLVGGGKRTWQDETSNRAFDTWYQAPTDRDIELSVSANISADGTVVQYLVDVNDTQNNNAVASHQTTYGSNEIADVPTITVPAGKQYRVRLSGGTGSIALKDWYERK
jgi:hypothetical protein